MANVFTQLAHKATSLSELMEGREKVTVDEVIENHPNGITIIGFDIVNSGLNSYPVVIFAENPSAYMNGGAILHNICEEWAKAFDGDIESATKALSSAGGVKMVFERSKTKSGNNITLAHIVD